MTLTTRQLTSGDWPSFWPLLKDMGTDDEETSARGRYDELLVDPRWGILGGIDGDRLIGYAAVQDYGPHLRLGNLHRIARLHDLYVHPDERGRGVGRVLMEGVTTWAAVRVRYLEWQAGHKTSAPFYERLGYKGEPCPQPEYPTFVIDFRTRTPDDQVAEI
ncbi:GNAT family N-acetyltransferase [Actinopolymorpha alba]|uniref:GNAT family N-acetyltransferase n=1 Tax=Actinopolymorpha alba TaxID=533267 RepID=UPI00036CC912|nr:GNAT family N-acetyltransferase [Actinopolymorpha alba]